MKKVHTYAALSLISLITGLVFFALYHNIIIFTVPHHTTTMPSSLIQKEKVTLFYFHNNKWKSEKQELLWSDSITKNTINIVNAWLTLLDEERITPKKATIQSVLLSNANTLYISLDHHIFTKDETIFNKWMIIESLLKTIKENNITVNTIQILVQHQQLNDPHLDFSLPWPLQGFIL